MAHFVIECPACGRYAEAKSGFFARKKIDCSCGNVINVRTDKLTSRVCPHCGNNVVFDQSKGEKAKCPVCGEPINTMAEMDKTVDFSCVQCGVRLRASRSAATFTCPVCDKVNDVAERYKFEEIKKSGLFSIIKYEGDNDTLVWKHPIEDFNLGSQLIVHESQEAIFFRDGQALDLFGPGRYSLETQQLPILEKLYKLPTDGNTPFHSEVYYINKVVQMAVKWGTPERVRFLDPLTGVPLELGASGEMNLQVADSRRLLVKLVGTMKGVAWEYKRPQQEDPRDVSQNNAPTASRENMTKSLVAAFRPLISNAVKVNLSAVIKENAIDLLEIDEKLELISERLRDKILPGFEDYGLTIPQFYVTRIVLPEENPEFQRIKKLHTITLQTRELEAQKTVKTAEEQTKAAIEAAHREAVLEQQTTQTEIAKRAAERKLIEAQADAEVTRMKGMVGVELRGAKGMTDAQVMAAKGYNQRDVLQAEVQKAYAEGIGNMGPDTVSGGAGASGIMGDMMSMGMGLAAMKNIMPQVNNMMQGMTGIPQPASGAPAAGGWTCPGCGTANIVTKFCPECGAPKPAPVSGWDCPACGCKGVTSKFCPECGAKKPEDTAPAGWDCPACGCKGITSKFCPECGAKKPEDAAPAGWDCPACGCKGITSKFCPECGAKKPEDAAPAPAGWDCPDCGEKNITSGFCPNCGRKK